MNQTYESTHLTLVTAYVLLRQVLRDEAHILAALDSLPELWPTLTDEQRAHLMQCVGVLMNFGFAATRLGETCGKALDKMADQQAQVTP